MQQLSLIAAHSVCSLAARIINAIKLDVFHSSQELLIQKLMKNLF